MTEVEFKTRMKKARTRLKGCNYTCVTLIDVFQCNGKVMDLYMGLFKPEDKHRYDAWLTPYFKELSLEYDHTKERQEIRLGLLECFEGFCLETQAYKGF